MGYDMSDLAISPMSHHVIAVRLFIILFPLLFAMPARSDEIYSRCGPKATGVMRSGKSFICFGAEGEPAPAARDPSTISCSEDGWCSLGSSSSGNVISAKIAEWVLPNRRAYVNGDESILYLFACGGKDGRYIIPPSGGTYQKANRMPIVPGTTWEATWRYVCSASR